MAFAEAFIVFSVVFLGGLAVLFGAIFATYRLAKFAAVSSQRVFARVSAQPVTAAVRRPATPGLRTHAAHRAVASITGSHTVRIA